MIERLAKLCLASYAEAPGPGWYDVQDLRFGVFRQPDGSLDLCFRGSANVRNWLRDLFVVPKRSWDGYLIHGGVADAVEVLAPLVRMLVPAGSRVTATGHSLGGGIAREIGRMYAGRVVTFGALKTDFRFGAMPKNDHYRVVCDDDPVPLVPGAFYVQDCAAALVLKDADRELVNARDHAMQHYLQRLRKAPG